jgi:hypothetical protein
MSETNSEAAPAEVTTAPGEVKTVPAAAKTMPPEATTAPAGVRTAPDPLALARTALRTSWPYAAGVLALLILAGVLFGGRAGWGDVPAWVLAITTLLAFVAASFAALVTYELLRIESRRDQVAAAERVVAADDRWQREEAERRSQASGVAAWYGRWSSVVKGPGMAADPREWPRWGAIISNASDLPVYNVRVSFCVAVEPSAALTWRHGERFVAALRLVPPGEQHVEMPDHIKAAEDAAGNETPWLVAIEFTDAAGSRWLRDPQGWLYPADASPAPAEGG